MRPFIEIEITIGDKFNNPLIAKKKIYLDQIESYGEWTSDNKNIDCSVIVTNNGSRYMINATYKELDEIINSAQNLLIIHIN